MAIYTRTGDGGSTDLLGGIRVSKDTAVLEVCGALDELNALLGMARGESLPDDTDALLERIQHQLFAVGGELVAGASGQTAAVTVGTDQIAAIERVIDRWESAIGSAETFILPAGCRAAGALHLARAVCRRAERRLVALAHDRPQTIPATMLAYVNRLSDLLFILARAANTQAGLSDTPC